MEVKFTPVERRILEMLSDGMPHTRMELKACLNDDMANDTAVRFHLVNLRNKLRPLGQDIVCISKTPKRPITYRQVRLLHAPDLKPVISEE